MKHKIVIKGIAAVLCAACCSFGVAAQPIQEDVILYPEHEQIRQEIQQLEQLEQWGVQQQEATRLHLQLSEEQWGSLVQNTAPPVWLSFLQLPYGKSELLERYIQQWEQTPEWTAEEIVTWVNANLDLPFYEQTVMAENPNSLTVLVNKYFALGAEFEPELVKMDAAYTTVPNAKMQPVAYEAFVKMAEAASQDGFRLYSVSAYRSYQTQKRLYQTYVATDGQELAESYSARPGYSEHQTGLSVDINTADFYSNFQNTDTYRWLRENSWKYGFILRYPEGKERITGYQFEPWHYRYVGVVIFSKIPPPQFQGNSYGWIISGMPPVLRWPVALELRRGFAQMVGCCCFRRTNESNYTPICCQWWTGFPIQENIQSYGTKENSMYQ